MQCLDGRDPLVGQLNWIRPSRRLSSHSGPILKRPGISRPLVSTQPLPPISHWISSMLSIRSPGFCRLANHCATNWTPESQAMNCIYSVSLSTRPNTEYHGFQVRYHTGPYRTALARVAAYRTVNICTARGLFRFEPKRMSHFGKPQVLEERMMASGLLTQSFADCIRRRYRGRWLIQTPFVSS